MENKKKTVVAEALGSFANAKDAIIYSLGLYSVIAVARESNHSRTAIAPIILSLISSRLRYLEGKRGTTGFICYPVGEGRNLPQSLPALQI